MQEDISPNNHQVLNLFSCLIYPCWSEWRDSNPRPSGPKPDALPDCATLRKGGRAVIALPDGLTVGPCESIERPTFEVKQSQYISSGCTGFQQLLGGPGTPFPSHLRIEVHCSFEDDILNCSSFLSCCLALVNTFSSFHLFAPNLVRAGGLEPPRPTASRF